MKLYTVPGQVRYETTRQVVLNGADAVVFVADSSTSREEQNRWSLQNLQMNTHTKGLDPKKIPVLFQFNKQDLPDAAPPEAVARWLRIPPERGLAAVATEGTGVLETFMGATSAMLQRLVGLADERTRQQIDAQQLERHLQRAFAPIVARQQAPGPADGPEAPGRQHEPLVIEGDDLVQNSVRTSVELGERWNGPIDASDSMMRLTLKIVSETLLGTKTDTAATTIGAAVDDAQRYAESVIGGLLPLPVTFPTPRFLRMKKSLNAMDEIAYGLIDERMASKESSDDVLSMLIEARDEEGRPLPRTQIRDELLTLLAAGHETTANALSWTLMLLSRHPTVWRRLVAEVDQVLGGRDPGFDDLGSLRFTRWVFEESLRLYPPAWVTGRLAAVAHELGGERLEPGNLLLLSPWVTHRRPDLWENPEGFDPDRWEKLSERGALEPFRFYPFGGGARKCVGEAFAYLEATIVLAMIAQRLRLDLIPGQSIVPAPQVTLGLAHGLRMNAVRREEPTAVRPVSQSAL